MDPQDPQDGTHLKAIRRELQLISERSERAIALIDGMIENHHPPSNNVDAFKGNNGRLTEAAIRAINTAYDAGVSVSEVSDQFNLAISTAVYRKKVWKEDQNTIYMRMHAKIIAGKPIGEREKALLKRRGLDEKQIIKFEELQIKSNEGNITRLEREELIILSNIANNEK